MLVVFVTVATHPRLAPLAMLTESGVTVTVTLLVLGVTTREALLRPCHRDY